MTDQSRDDLLSRLAGIASPEDASQAWSELAPTLPEHDPQRGTTAPTATPEPTRSADSGEEAIDRLCQRVTNLVGGAPAALQQEPADHREFMPDEPETLAEAGLLESDIEALALKYLLATGTVTGHDLTDQIRLPFRIVDAVLHQMKQDQLVAHKGAAQMGDYVYQISDLGRERARRLSQQCTYYGCAPVTLHDYIHSVGAQTIADQHPTVDSLRSAFSDLLLNQRMLNRLGPAVNSGRGLFLFGAPGNGKTSIAERVTKAFGQTIWIPRCLTVEGNIIRLFDPSVHEEIPIDESEGILDTRRFDRRWIRIRRPTIVVGGELTMGALEITTNTSTHINEAPLQMKSNAGTLVIDDFGRQRMSVDELLNRWIVPLEKRYDFLNLPNGKKIQVPFDQLIIFSTNLEPRDLVDDAFLRRIPYKIEVVDPSEEEFRELFRLMAPKLGFVYRDDPIDYLIEKHYHSVDRPFRCCQPRDLLMQVRNYCLYQGIEPELSREYLDLAVEAYFAVM